jgi:hypothetical protein
MKTTITFLLVFFSLHIAFSQNEVDESSGDIFGKFSLHLTMGIPVQEFADAMDDNAAGIGFSFLMDIPETPVSAGVQFDYLSFNHKKMRVTSPIGNTGFEGDYDWTTRSQALIIGAVFRLQPKHEFLLKPYGEGSLGMRRLFTNTTLTGRNSSYNPNFGTDLDISDWSLYYGGAVGIAVLLSPEVMLDLSCNFIIAPSADVYTKKKNAGTVEDPLDAFELKHSASTNMILPRIGVSFLLSND